jgi:hypothetical protein
MQNAHYLDGATCGSIKYVVVINMHHSISGFNRIKTFANRSIAANQLKVIE